MTKVVTVEYDAAEQVLRLEAPLEGVKDHAKLQVTVENAEAVSADRWDSLRSSVSKEQLDELASIIDDMFPIEK